MQPAIEDTVNGGDMDLNQRDWDVTDVVERQWMKMHALTVNAAMVSLIDNDLGSLPLFLLAKVDLGSLSISASVNTAAGATGTGARSSCVASDGCGSPFQAVVVRNEEAV